MAGTTNTQVLFLFEPTQLLKTKEVLTHNQTFKKQIPELFTKLTKTFLSSPESESESESAALVAQLAQTEAQLFLVLDPQEAFYLVDLSTDALEAKKAQHHARIIADCFELFKSESAEKSEIIYPLLSARFPDYFPDLNDLISMLIQDQNWPGILNIIQVLGPRSPHANYSEIILEIFNAEDPGLSKFAVIAKLQSFLKIDESTGALAEVMADPVIKDNVDNSGFMQTFAPMINQLHVILTGDFSGTFFSSKLPELGFGESWLHQSSDKLRAAALSAGNDIPRQISLIADWLSGVDIKDEDGTALENNQSYRVKFLRIVLRELGFSIGAESEQTLKNAIELLVTVLKITQVLLIKPENTLETTFEKKLNEAKEKDEEDFARLVRPQITRPVLSSLSSGDWEFNKKFLLAQLPYFTTRFVQLNFSGAGAGAASGSSGISGVTQRETSDQFRILKQEFREFLIILDQQCPLEIPRFLIDADPVVFACLEISEAILNSDRPNASQVHRLFLNLVNTLPKSSRADALDRLTFNHEDDPSPGAWTSLQLLKDLAISQSKSRTLQAIDLALEAPDQILPFHTSKWAPHPLFPPLPATLSAEKTLKQRALEKIETKKIELLDALQHLSTAPSLGAGAGTTATTATKIISSDQIDFAFLHDLGKTGPDFITLFSNCLIENRLDLAGFFHQAVQLAHTCPKLADQKIKFGLAILETAYPENPAAWLQEKLKENPEQYLSLALLLFKNRPEWRLDQLYTSDCSDQLESYFSYLLTKPFEQSLESQWALAEQAGTLLLLLSRVSYFTIQDPQDSEYSGNPQYYIKIFNQLFATLNIDYIKKTFSDLSGLKALKPHGQYKKIQKFLLTQAKNTEEALDYLILELSKPDFKARGSRYKALVKLLGLSDLAESKWPNPRMILIILMAARLELSGKVALAPAISAPVLIELMSPWRREAVLNPNPLRDSARLQEIKKIGEDLFTRKASASDTSADLYQKKVEYLTLLYVLIKNAKTAISPAKLILAELIPENYSRTFKKICELFDAFLNPDFLDIERHLETMTQKLPKGPASGESKKLKTALDLLLSDAYFESISEEQLLLFIDSTHRDKHAQKRAYRRYQIIKALEEGAETAIDGNARRSIMWELIEGILPADPASNPKEKPALNPEFAYGIFKFLPFVHPMNHCPSLLDEHRWKLFLSREQIEKIENIESLRTQYFSSLCVSLKIPLTDLQTKLLFFSDLIWTAVEARNIENLEEAFLLINKAFPKPLSLKLFIFCFFNTHPIPMTLDRFNQAHAFFKAQIDIIAENTSSQTLARQWEREGERYALEPFVSNRLSTWRTPERLALLTREIKDQLDIFYRNIQGFSRQIRTHVPVNWSKILGVLDQQMDNSSLSEWALYHPLWRNEESTRNTLSRADLFRQYQFTYLTQRSLLMLARAAVESPNLLNPSAHGELLENIFSHLYFTADLFIELVTLVFLNKVSPTPTPTGAGAGAGAGAGSSHHPQEERIKSYFELFIQITRKKYRLKRVMGLLNWLKTLQSLEVLKAADESTISRLIRNLESIETRALPEALFTLSKTLCHTDGVASPALRERDGAERFSLTLNLDEPLKTELPRVLLEREKFLAHFDKKFRDLIKTIHDDPKRNYSFRDATLENAPFLRFLISGTALPFAMSMSELPKIYATFKSLKVAEIIFQTLLEKEATPEIWAVLFDPKQCPSERICMPRNVQILLDASHLALNHFLSALSDPRIIADTDLRAHYLTDLFKLIDLEDSKLLQHPNLPDLLRKFWLIPYLKPEIAALLRLKGVTPSERDHTDLETTMIKSVADVLLSPEITNQLRNKLVYTPLTGVKPHPHFETLRNLLKTPGISLMDTLWAIHDSVGNISSTTNKRFEIITSFIQSKFSPDLRETAEREFSSLENFQKTIRVAIWRIHLIHPYKLRMAMLRNLTPPDPSGVAGAPNPKPRGHRPEVSDWSATPAPSTKEEEETKKKARQEAERQEAERQSAAKKQRPRTALLMGQEAPSGGAGGPAKPPKEFSPHDDL